MNVNVLLAEEVRIDAVALAIRARPGQRCGHRLLHDFTEMPGHGELLAAAHTGGLNEDDIAAHWRPREANGHAWRLGALGHFGLGGPVEHLDARVRGLAWADPLLRASIASGVSVSSLPFASTKPPP